MRIELDKISSSSRNASLAKSVVLTDKIVAREGYILAVKALEEKSVYNEIELTTGRMTKVFKGDILSVVLGERRALRGYAGIVPPQVNVGDILSLLNKGGVVGKCTSENHDLGPPLRVEVLGAILDFPSPDNRVGVPANVMKNAIPMRNTLEFTVPLVVVSGTCMNSGKTSAACEIIKILNKWGHRVGAAKVTGVSLMRDTLEMEDSGAVRCLNFTDAGIVSTTSCDVPSLAKGIVYELNKSKVNVIVVELGDGILGEYGVQSLLRDPELMRFVASHVMCANDPVAAWGAVEQFKLFGLNVDVMAGPVTDNFVGTHYVEEKLNIPAINARTDGIRLGEFIRSKVFGNIG